MPRQRAGPAVLPAQFAVTEFSLHPEPRVDHLEEKAAFVPAQDLYQYATPEVDASLTIEPGSVVDLRPFIRVDGTLQWTPPTGRWTVLRIGYSLLGITNHPATPEATGLEVDKLDRRFVKAYFEKYLDGYRDAVGAAEMGKRGIQNIVNDSWEAGSQKLD